VDHNCGDDLPRVTADHPDIKRLSSNGKNLDERPLSTSKKFLFSSITFLVFFLTIEIVLISFGFTFKIAGNNSENDHWFGLGFQQDPELPWSWIPIPGGGGVAGSAQFQFNDEGFRESHVDARNAIEETLRVVCMGDSCTMGWEVLNHQTFCHLLKELLEKSLSITVETINAGVPGYSSFQGLHQLEKRVLSLKPDVIVFSYCWNDHTFAIHMHETLDVFMDENFFGQSDKDLPGPTWSSKIHSSLSRLRSYKMMDFFASNLRKQETEDAKDAQEVLVNVEKVPVRVPLSDYKANFKRMISLSREKGITPILMNQPSQPIRSTNAFTELAKSLNYKAPDEKSWIQFCRIMRSLFIRRQQEYNDALIEVAKENKVLFVDMISIFEKYENLEELLIDPVHPTPKGHNIIANELKETILKVATED
jgi:lysophospholipase L1-like esterase